MNINNKRIHDVILYGVIALYFLILIVLLFFKSNAAQTVNFIPFRFIWDYFIKGGALALSNVLGNILMFIPMGVYIALLNNKTSLQKNLLLIVCFSATVEMLQLILKRGVLDIDDVILNGTGGLLGILLYKKLDAKFSNRIRSIIEISSLAIGAAFVILLLCLQFGVFGITIRLL